MAAVRDARQLSAHPGFLLLEALIGFALFALFLTAVGLTVLVSQQGTSASALRSRAVARNTAAVDAVRLLRRGGFSTLPTGTHGVAVQNGAWVFAGTGSTEDGFTTTVTLAEEAEGRMAVRARTTWTGSGSAELFTELTDWTDARAVGDWSAPQTVGSWSTTDTPLFGRVAAGNGIAVVTGDTSAGGAGLYLFDIAMPSSPERIATDFTLGFSGHDLVLAGQTLYVVTEDPAAELRVYSLENPVGFSAASLLASYDIPGTARGLSLTLKGTTLMLGASPAEGEDEVYLFDVADPADPVLEGSIDIGASVTAMDTRDSGLFMATDDDAAELRIADIADPAAPVAPSGSGYNLTDVTDAAAVVATGTAAVLGRLGGAFTEELVLFTIGDDLDDLGSSGPWYWEVGDAVHALALDPSQQYAFAATAYAGREFSVVDLPRWRDGLSAIVASVASTTGEGRGVFYDPAADRVYHITRQTFSILRPS